MLAKILVVDDEPDLEPLIQQHFDKKIQEGELQFIFARDGIEALEIVKSDPKIDLVLTDIKMPRMDGLTLLSELGELNLILKAVVISAYDDMENIRVAMNRGAFDFLTKPIEFEDLEITIYKTLQHVQQLKENLLLQKELITLQQELDIARRIQQSILPERIPDLPGLDIQVRYLPMATVGGDFYGFHVINQKKLGVFVTDVSGHGIPAALIAARAEVVFSLQKPIAHDPSKVLININQTLYGKHKNQFLTASYIYLDLENQKLSHANAGHFPLLIWRRKEQSLQELKPEGIVIGLMPEISCPAVEVDIKSGDRILLYTDIIVESRNRSGELFGETRFLNLIQEKQDLSASEFADSILESVSNWSDRKEGFDDDLTLIVLDILES
jgi:sigma-B regulation protein RsbU (phosphoserine phosphatase)